MPKVETSKSLSQKLKIQMGVCKVTIIMIIIITIIYNIIVTQYYYQRMIKEVMSYEKEVITNQGNYNYISNYLLLS